MRYPSDPRCGTARSFDTVGVRDSAVADFTDEEPFASLLGFPQTLDGTQRDLNRVSALKEGVPVVLVMGPIPVVTSENVPQAQD